jgi:phosphate transport system substrate-binding protein
MRKTAFFIIAAVLLLAAQVCAGQFYDLITTGDHSVWVIVNDVKGAFEKDTKISLDLIPELAIVGKGCGKGILHARRGTPDREFGLICCTLDDSVIRNFGVKLYPIAREPLAIIVNKSNPVNGLTILQLRDIFSGRITNWKAVGGRNEKIAVIVQLHCRDYTPNWKGIFPDPETFTKKRVDVKAQPEMAKTVSDFKQAIGHLEMTSVMESKDPVKILTIDGYLPNSENMEKGLYPLFASLAVATKGEAEGKVVTFIEYMRSNPGVREAMKKYGMVPAQ